MNRVIGYLLALLGGYLLYQFRYRLLNLILGNQTMRAFFIRLSLRIPFVRDKFLHKAFF
ncbi:hypothetical protein J9317_13025 [Metabacillus sp. KIGAM252]|uniref:Sodium:proton antiporter n=1 Tax=Metabacillus flavus TaxID=2823519 RepID=A0ABS5LG18_9BACI|nr:hypothetical protein [Metabacillus flavus]MBS2969688.1 hypothetical protein [Metabacillus flavus]